MTDRAHSELTAGHHLWTTRAPVHNSASHSAWVVDTAAWAAVSSHWSCVRGKRVSGRAAPPPFDEKTSTRFDKNCNVFYVARIEALGDDDLTSWLTPRPELAAGLGALSGAVYQHSALPLRVREIARMRIAEDNECEVCRNTRHGEGEAEGVDEEFYRHVVDWRDWPGYSERERIAAEFAERIATDHRALREDEDYWSRCKAHFDDAEILDLGICCALWLGSGRLMRVLNVAQACRVVL